jgi:hypothetical protein
MAKSDLLKEAIADAKAVKETALANAKIALEEAFAPRIQSMLSAKLSEDLDEEEMDMEMDMEAPADDMEMDAPMDDAAPTVTVDGEEYVKADDAGAGEAEAEIDNMDMDMDMSTDEGMMYDVDEDPTDDMSNEDLELEAIIRELEEDLDEEINEEVVEEDAQNPDAADSTDSKGNDLMAEPKEMKNEEFNIDEIIEEILSEDEEGEAEMAKDDELKEAEEEVKDKTKELEEDLHEAYETIGSLRDTINEVNLLNAKLLYTNKLFRNFELSENQKMTVIENFDRAGNTREVKLVFSTLAESFQLPVKKRAIVKESFASKATGTTAPSKEATKQIINEGNELANRWKKLAGLL